MINSVVCEGADFCEEISGVEDTAFGRVYEGDPPSRRILGTENFELLADMSPLVVGHLLLLPKRHYLSFAQVIQENPGEVESLLGRLTSLYSATFGSPLVLEHGSTVDSDHHACITHAHLHLLPVEGAAVDEYLVRDGLDYQDLPSLSHLGSPPWTRSPYFLRYYDGQARAYVPTAAHRRQYLRSAVGATLSIEDPEWDYALVVRKPFLRTTMKMVEAWSLR